MKKICLLLVVVLLGFQAQEIFAQNGVKYHYGILDTTGINKVIPGAMYKQRPWIKDFVEKGVLAPGCDTLILSEDCFILFASNENNPLDINYIVVPKGDTLLVKDGKRYYPKCGNLIVSMRKVSEYEKMEPDTAEGKIVLRDPINNTSVNINIINSFNTTQPAQTPQTTPAKSDQQKKKREVKLGPFFIGLGIGAIIGSGVTYLLMKDKKAVPGQGKDPDLEVPETPKPETGQGQDGGLG